MNKEEYEAWSKEQPKWRPHKNSFGAWDWLGSYSHSLLQLFRILIFRRGLGRFFCILAGHTKDPDDKYPLSCCLVCGKNIEMLP